MLRMIKVKNRIFNFIHQNRRVIFHVGFCIFLLLIASNKALAAEDSLAGNIMNGVSSGVGAAVALLVGFIALLVTSAMGLFSTVLISVLVSVAQYNSFIVAPPVVAGWTIIRDICNMFFILILLIIAFATILRMENYSVKKMLPKLLIMAVLINFSKTIFGLIIDASQVVMMTFVNAFSQGTGFFVNMLQTAEILKNITLSSKDSKVLDNWIIATSLILAVIASIITVIVLAVMVAILIVRIVMIWIYTIFSPLVFLGFAFPPIQKYTGQVWQDFIKQVIVGPVLAFFIWLALTTQGTAPLNTSTDVCAGVASFFCAPNFQKFLITIGLLMGGMMVAQQMGGAAAGIAGKGLNWAKGAAKLSYKAPAFGGDWLGRKIKMGNIPVIGKTLAGLELRPTKIYQGVKDALIDQKRREESFATGVSAGAMKKGGVGGLIKGLGVSRDLMENISGPGGFLWWKGIRRTWKGTVAGGPEASGKLIEEIKTKKKELGSTQEEIDAKAKERDDALAERNSYLNRDGTVKAGKEEEVKKLNQTNQILTNQLLEMRKNVVTKDDKEKQSKKIEEMEKDLVLKRPVQTYYADRERDALISEARQKLGNNDNEEDLVEKFQDAVVNGNREVAQAVMVHAARVGHLNEIIQFSRSTKDAYDKEGNLIAKKGKFLPQGGHGLNELVNQYLIGKLGIDQQSALATQSEASSLAKATRHFNLAESVGAKNGYLFQRDHIPQQNRARGELRKVPSASVIRDYNRLSWGNEIQTTNSKGEIERKFQINQLGLDNFMELADTINSGIRESRWNKNAAMNVASDIGTLKDWVKLLESKGIKEFTTIKSNGDMEKMQYSELVEKIEEYGNNVRTASQLEDYGGLKKEFLSERQKKS